MGGTRFVESLTSRPRQSAALQVAIIAIACLLLASCSTTPKPGEEINVNIPRPPVEVTE